MAIGKPLRLRLFLEGLEVPVISAQVTAGPNSPSIASIQIVPIDEGMEFFPRTMVHLFFLDTNAVISPGGNSTQGTQDPTVSSIATDYRLLFTGEIVGFSMQQTPSQRALILQCLDFSSYWDSAHALAIEYGPGGNAFTQHGSVYGGAVGTFDDIANHMQEKLVQWLKQQPQTPGLQSVSGLAGGIIRMLESMGGVPGHYKGVNDFFTAAELRCRILDQITAEENDNTASRILDAKVLDQWIRNGLNNIGLQVTFRDLMKLLFQYIFYEFVPNPTAKWDPAVSQGQNKNVPGVTARVSTSPDAQAVLADCSTILDYIGGVLSSGSSDTTYFTNQAKSILSNISDATTHMNSLRTSSPAFASIASQVLTALNQAKLDISPYTISSTSSLSGFNNCETDISKVQNLINSNGNVVVSTKNSVQSSSVSMRLRSQIIKPDCWFSAPPKCNVIFPEMYTQFSYERNYLTEVTRSLVQKYESLSGPDALLSHFILVPSVGSSTTGLVNKSGNVGYRTLMDHEVHTGIIPRHDRLSNVSAVGATTNTTNRKQVKQSRFSWIQRAGLFNFFKYRFASRQMSIGMRFNPFLVVGFPALLLRKPFLVSPSNSTVQAGASESDIINNILTGAQSGTLSAPYQFLGMVASLVHNIDQAGGTTSVQLATVRKHEGLDDEFLNQFIKDPAGPNLKVVKTIIRYTDINGSSGPADVASLKLLAGCTPQSLSPASSTPTNQTGTSTTTVNATMQSVNPATGQIDSNTTELNYTVLNQNALSSGSAATLVAPANTIYGQITGAGLNRSPVLLPNPYGKIKPQSKNGRYGPQGGVVLGIEVLDSGINKNPKYGNMFNAVALYEQIPITTTGTAPFEEVVRPPWFSQNYSNANIGPNIYTPFFGCLSIVDDLNVLGLNDATPVIQLGTDPDTQNFDTTDSVTDVVQQLQNQANNTITQSVENATNLLAYIYGQVKTQGLDVDQFIRSYVDRPIASKTQILGSDDLQISVDSNGVASATQGQIGFHSASVNIALALQGNFSGLATDSNLGLKRVDSTGKNSPVDPRLDIREANGEQVTLYLTALQSHAFIG